MEEDETKVLFSKDPVSIFSIKPELTVHETLQARNWSVDNPEWQGKLVVSGSARAGECQFRFLYPDGTLFAKMVINGHPSPLLQPVTDSSRYFVILMNKFPNASFKIQGGLGFFQREDSNDLLTSVKAFFEKLQGQKRPASEAMGLQTEDKRSKPPVSPAQSKLKESLQCSKCTMRFKYDFQRRHHEADHHEKNVSCPCCGSVLKKRFKLYKHIEQLHSEEIQTRIVAVKCQECNQKFLTETEYKIHLPVHQNPSLTCPFCVNWKFLCYSAASKETGLQQYDQHLNQAHPEVCKQEKPDMSKSPTHPPDGGSKQMTSDERAEERRQKFQLKKAQKAQTSDREQQDRMEQNLQVCIRCDETFPQVSLLVKHILEKHSHESQDGSPMIVGCQKCSAKFTCQRSLCCHMYATHKQVDCPLCDSWSDIIGSGRFQNMVLTDFVEHVKETHQDSDQPTTKNDELPASRLLGANNFLPDGYEYLNGQKGMFRCYKCPAAYRTHKTLRKHWLKVHKLQQTCFCFICHLPFPAPGQLRHHIFEVHGLIGNVNELSQFSMDKTEANCHLCTEKFDYYLDLMTHVRQQHHSSKNPVLIKCEVCTQRFLKPADYRLHLERHQQNPGCPICIGWSFSGPKHLGFKFLTDHIIGTHTPSSKFKKQESTDDDASSQEESKKDKSKRGKRSPPRTRATVAASKLEAPVSAPVQQIPGYTSF